MKIDECPECESMNIDCFDAEIANDEHIAKCYCEACGIAYDIVHTMVYKSYKKHTNE